MPVSFLALPAELRLQIYEKTTDSSVNHVWISRQIPFRRSFALPTNELIGGPALLCVCRQVYIEYFDIFYRFNRFRVCPGVLYGYLMAPEPLLLKSPHSQLPFRYIYVNLHPGSQRTLICDNFLRFLDACPDLISLRLDMRYFIAQEFTQRKKATRHTKVFGINLIDVLGRLFSKPDFRLTLWYPPRSQMSWQRESGYNTTITLWRLPTSPIDTTGSWVHSILFKLSKHVDKHVYTSNGGWNPGLSKEIYLSKVWISLKCNDYGFVEATF